MHKIQVSAHPVSENETDTTANISSQDLTQTQLPPSFSTSISEANGKGNIACVTSAKNSEDVVKKRKIILLKRENPFNDEIIVQKTAKKVCTPDARLKLTGNNGSTNQTVIKKNSEISVAKPKLEVVKYAAVNEKKHVRSEIKNWPLDKSKDKPSALEVINERHSPIDIVKEKSPTLKVAREKPLVLEVSKEEPSTSKIVNEKPSFLKLAKKKLSALEVSKERPLNLKIPTETHSISEITKEKLSTLKVLKKNTVIKLTNKSDKLRSVSSNSLKITLNAGCKSKEQDQTPNNKQKALLKSSPVKSEPYTASSNTSSKTCVLKSNKRKKAKQNLKKIIWENDDFIKENSNVFNLEKLNSLEREIFQSYKNELSDLIHLNRNRFPNKIIIIADERDVFTEKFSTTNFHYQIIKGVNLSFENLMEYLVQEPEFGSGVLYLILCGINSLNRERINPSCLSVGCSTPCLYLDDTTFTADLIKQAINVHKLILNYTRNDTAIFAGLHPSSPKYFNNNNYQKRECSEMHKATFQKSTAMYDISKIYLYNIFTKLHSEVLGFIPLNMERGFSIKDFNIKTVRFEFDGNIKNGYHFTDKFAYNRKLALLRKCDKLMEELSHPRNMEHQKNISKLKSNLQINCPPSNFSTSESTSIPKYEKVVVIGNSRYTYFLKQLEGPKVCVMTDNITTKDLPSYIESKAVLMPLNTLWVLITGIDFLFCNRVNESCSELSCLRPLSITEPSFKVSTISRALSTFNDVKEALSLIDRNIKMILNPQSDFILFPPIPPAMIIESSFAHKNLHTLRLKFPRGYIVTSEMGLYFRNIFERLSLSFALLTREALCNLGILVDPLEKYLDCKQNQMDFIDTTATPPSNKLPFFTEWSNMFKSIVLSCVGNSNSFDSTNLRVSNSSRVVVFSNDYDDKSFAKYPIKNKTLPGIKSKNRNISKLGKSRPKKASIIKKCSDISCQIIPEDENSSFMTASKVFSPVEEKVMTPTELNSDSNSKILSTGVSDKLKRAQGSILSSNVSENDRTADDRPITVFPVIHLKTTPKSEIVNVNEEISEGNINEIAENLASEILDTDLAVSNSEISDMNLAVSNSEISDRDLTVSNREILDKDLAVSNSEITDMNLAVSNSEISDKDLAVSNSKISGRDLAVSNSEISDRDLAVSNSEISEKFFLAVSNSEISDMDLALSTGEVSDEDLALSTGEISDEDLALSTGEISDMELALSVSNNKNKEFEKSQLSCYDKCEHQSKENNTNKCSVRISGSVSGCNSSLTETGKVSSKVKEKALTSPNLGIVSNLNPASESVSKNSKENVSSHEANKLVKKSNIKEKCDIYDLAADARPLFFTPGLEPNVNAKHKLELKINDAFEEVSDVDLSNEAFEEVSDDDLSNEIFNDLTSDISDTEFAEDFIKHSSGSVQIQSVKDTSDQLSSRTADVDSVNLNAKDVLNKSITESNNEQNRAESLCKKQLNIGDTNFKEKELENSSESIKSNSKEGVVLIKRMFVKDQTLNTPTALSNTMLDKEVIIDHQPTSTLLSVLSEASDLKAPEKHVLNNSETKKEGECINKTEISVHYKKTSCERTNIAKNNEQTNSENEPELVQDAAKSQISAAEKEKCNSCHSISNVGLLDGGDVSEKIMKTNAYQSLTNTKANFSLILTDYNNKINTSDNKSSANEKNVSDDHLINLNDPHRQANLLMKMTELSQEELRINDELEREILEDNEFEENRTIEKDATVDDATHDQRNNDGVSSSFEARNSFTDLTDVSSDLINIEKDSANRFKISESSPPSFNSNKQTLPNRDPNTSNLDNQSSNHFLANSTGGFINSESSVKDTQKSFNLDKYVHLRSVCRYSIGPFLPLLSSLGSKCSVVEADKKENTEMLGSSCKSVKNSTPEHASNGNHVAAEGREHSKEISIIQNEKDKSKPITVILISDSEDEENSNSKSIKDVNTVEKGDMNIIEEVSNIINSVNDVNNTEQEIEDLIPHYDDLYIFGQSNPIFKKNRKVLNFTFVKKNVLDLGEEDVEHFLREKDPIRANSLCVFVSNVSDVIKVLADSNSQGKGSIEISDESISEGKKLINNKILSFANVIRRLRSKMQVVVMPLEPCISELSKSENRVGTDSNVIHKIFPFYKDHLVKVWNSITDTNDRRLRYYTGSFVNSSSLSLDNFNKNGQLSAVNHEGWKVKVNEVIMSLVKPQMIKNPEKNVKSIKNMANVIAESVENEMCEFKVTNVGESVPKEFFDEMSKVVGKSVSSKMEEGYMRITCESHQDSHLFANYLNDLSLGDTVLRTTFFKNSCNDSVVLTNAMKKNFRLSLKSCWEYFEPKIVTLAARNLQHMLSCESIKTIMCEESDCNETKCIFYHTEYDKRRNPFSTAYGSKSCSKLKLSSNRMRLSSCCYMGDDCIYSHNSFESAFHPKEAYFELCHQNKSKKECFLVNPLCTYAHRGSPEIFFTEFWTDLLLYGIPLAVEFLAGAIRKFDFYNSLYKDCRIFMMSSSYKFLRNVQGAVKNVCRTRELMHNFVGERNLTCECEPLLFGTPSKFVENLDRLALFRYTVVIVAQINTLLSDEKEKEALSTFFSRSKMAHAPPFVQSLFVSDEVNSEDMKALIKSSLGKDVKIITDMGHKVKFEHEVPYTPLKSMPESLDASGIPSEVYELSPKNGISDKRSKTGGEESAEGTCSYTKKLFASNAFKSKHYSKSLPLKNRYEKDYIRRSKKKKSEIIHSRKNLMRISPSEERIRKRRHKRSRSSSASRSPPTKYDVKSLPSPPIDSFDLDENCSSSSMSTKMSSLKRKRKGSSNTKDITHKSLSKEDFGMNEIKDNTLGSILRERFYVNNNDCTIRPPSRKRLKVNDIKNSNISSETSHLKGKQDCSSSSRSCHNKNNLNDTKGPTSASPQKGSDVTDSSINVKRSQSSKSLSNIEDSDYSCKKRTFPQTVTPNNKIEKEMNLSDLPSSERASHQSFLLELAAEYIDATSLKEELGTSLYEEFEAAKRRTCILLDEEFIVYDAMPEMYVLYEEFYEEFLLSYQTKYPNDSDDNNRKKLWKGFWRSKLKLCEKVELQNRILKLIVDYKEKVSSSRASTNSGEGSRKEFSECEVPNTSKSHNTTSNENSRLVSSVHIITSTVLREEDSSHKRSECKAAEDKRVANYLNLGKALSDLESMIPDVGVLGAGLEAIVGSVKENVTSEKYLEILKDPDNVTLIELALAKIESKYLTQGRGEEYTSLKKSIAGLLEHAEKSPMLKEDESSFDYETSAKRTVDKDPQSILKMIRATADEERRKLMKVLDIVSFSEEL